MAASRNRGKKKATLRDYSRLVLIKSQRIRFCCVVIALAFLAAGASDSWGQSNGENPPPGQEAKTLQQPAPADQRGTEQSPAFVKIIPAPKTAEEASAARKEKEQKDTNDIRLVWFTGLLAAIGFFQLLVFGWQGYQLKLTVAAAQDATKLGRDEFIATHRPRIRVYGFDMQMWQEAEKGPVHFRFVNRGDSRAFITEVGTTILVTKREVPKAGVEFSVKKLSPTMKVEIGEHGFQMTKDEIDVTTAIFSDREHKWLMCIGYVAYRDDNGTIRQTGFCRRYNAESYRWERVSDEDYEYEY